MNFVLFVLGLCVAVLIISFSVAQKNFSTVPDPVSDCRIDFNDCPRSQDCVFSPTLRRNTCLSRTGRTPCGVIDSLQECDVRIGCNFCNSSMLYRCTEVNVSFATFCTENTLNSKICTPVHDECDNKKFYIGDTVHVKEAYTNNSDPDKLVSLARGSLLSVIKNFDDVKKLTSCISKSGGSSTPLKLIFRSFGGNGRGQIYQPAEGDLLLVNNGAEDVVVEVTNSSSDRGNILSLLTNLGETSETVLIGASKDGKGVCLPENAIKQANEHPHCNPFTTATIFSEIDAGNNLNGISAQSTGWQCMCTRPLLYEQEQIGQDCIVEKMCRTTSDSKFEFHTRVPAWHQCSKTPASGSGSGSGSGSVSPDNDFVTPDFIKDEITYFKNSGCKQHTDCSKYDGHVKCCNPNGICLSVDSTEITDGGYKCYRTYQDTKDECKNAIDIVSDSFCNCPVGYTYNNTSYQKMCIKIGSDDCGNGFGFKTDGKTCDCTQQKGHKHQGGDSLNHTGFISEKLLTNSNIHRQSNFQGQDRCVPDFCNSNLPQPPPSRRKGKPIMNYFDLNTAKCVCNKPYVSGFTNMTPLNPSGDICLNMCLHAQCAKLVGQQNCSTVEINILGTIPQCSNCPCPTCNTGDDCMISYTTTGGGAGGSGSAAPVSAGTTLQMNAADMNALQTKNPKDPRIPQGYLPGTCQGFLVSIANSMRKQTEGGVCISSDDCCKGLTCENDGQTNGPSCRRHSKVGTSSR